MAQPLPHDLFRIASTGSRHRSSATAAGTPEQVPQPEWATADTGLLIASGAFLHSGDFTERFIHRGTSVSDGTPAMAAIDWNAAITALNASELPCSGGEQHILRSREPRRRHPVSLSQTVTGLDQRNANHLILAIRRAPGMG